LTGVLLVRLLSVALTTVSAAPSLPMNPYALLRDLETLLADGGRLLISTPNPLAFPVGSGRPSASRRRSRRCFLIR
jgi:hypothetical protein